MGVTTDEVMGIPVLNLPNPIIDNLLRARKAYTENGQLFKAASIISFLKDGQIGQFQNKENLTKTFIIR